MPLEVERSETHLYTFRYTIYSGQQVSPVAGTLHRLDNQIDYPEAEGDPRLCLIDVRNVIITDKAKLIEGCPEYGRGIPLYAATVSPRRMTRTRRKPFTSRTAWTADLCRATQHTRLRTLYGRFSLHGFRPGRQPRPTPSGS